MDAIVLSRHACFVCLLAAASVAGANAKPCSPSDAEAADAMVDHLNSWDEVAKGYNKFGHCDDGSIAEGNSEAIARLLVDQWATLPRLAELIKRDPKLKRYVLRHVDATLESQDLEKIQSLSASACPPNAAVLCNGLNSASARGLGR